MKGLNVKKVQEMFKRWRFRLSDIEYGVDVVYLIAKVNSCNYLKLFQQISILHLL